MAYAGDAGPTHFNELIKAGKIRGKKDGGKLIVDLDSIDEYFSSCPMPQKRWRIPQRLNSPTRPGVQPGARQKSLAPPFKAGAA